MTSWPENLECSHCGRQGKTVKRCARCGGGSYCGAVCQKAASTLHTKTCFPFLDEVVPQIMTMAAASDWRGLQKWEGHIAELIDVEKDTHVESLLDSLANARKMLCWETGCMEHLDEAIKLFCLRVRVLQKTDRYSDQAEALHSIGDCYLHTDEREEAASFFQLARQLCSKHRIISVYVEATISLGDMADEEGRPEEGVLLYRNAYLTAESDTDTAAVLSALSSLCGGLVATEDFDELEARVPRFRAAAKEETRRLGHPSIEELKSMLVSAQLHEVLSFRSFRV